MQQIRSAITGSGKPDHPSIVKFYAEATLYKHVGLNFNDLRHRPIQEVHDYLTISSMIASEEARLAKKHAAESMRN